MGEKRQGKFEDTKEVVRNRRKTENTILLSDLKPVVNI
jgi:hypothetical protein